MLFHKFTIMSVLSADEIAILLNENISQPPTGFLDGLKKIFGHKSFKGQASNQEFKLTIDEGRLAFKAACISGTITPLENQTKIYASITMDTSSNIILLTLVVLYMIYHRMVPSLFLYSISFGVLFTFYMSLFSTKRLFLNALNANK